MTSHIQLSLFERIKIVIKRLQTVDLTKGNPVKQITCFMIPLLISGILQQLYGIVDAAVIGKYCGLDAYAAVGATGPILFAHLGAIWGITTGAAVITAQYFGAKKDSEIKRSYASSYVVGIASGLVMTLLVLPLTGNIVEWMRFPPETCRDAKIYLYCIFGGTVSSALYNTAFCQARSIGDSMTPLLWLIVSTFLNIVLDILFVAVFKWSVLGVGIATFLATTISAIGCIISLHHHHPILRLTRSDWNIGRRIVLNQFVVGVPMAMQFVLTAIGILVRQTATNTLGSVVVAAYSTACKIEGLLCLPLFLIGNAIATYAAQNYGARKFKRLKYGVRASMLGISLYSAIAAAFALYFYESLTRMFLPNPDDFLLSCVYIYLFSSTLFYIALGGLIIYRSTLQGTNHQIVPLIGGFVELACRSLTAFPLLNAYGYVGLVYTEAITWTTTFILDYGYYFYLTHSNHFTPPGKT